MRHLLAFILCAFLSCVQELNAQVFANLPIEFDDKHTLPLAEKISFEFITSNKIGVENTLSEWKNIEINQLSNDSFSVTMVAQPEFIGELRDQYLKQSFVIDLEEEVIKELVVSFLKQVDNKWVLDDVVKYVEAHIDEETYVHGFNIASVVAKERSGDCTEHAVLTTALARSLGLPSRVVVGTVIFEDKGELSAIGHAWSEVWHNEKWQILDAALYSSEDIKYFYFPSGELGNEGLGFGMSLFTLVGRMPIRITRLRNTVINNSF